MENPKRPIYNINIACFHITCESSERKFRIHIKQKRVKCPVNIETYVCEKLLINGCKFCIFLISLCCLFCFVSCIGLVQLQLPPCVVCTMMLFSFLCNHVYKSHILLKVAQSRTQVVFESGRTRALILSRPL